MYCFYKVQFISMHVASESPTLSTSFYSCSIEIRCTWIWLMHWT